MTNWGARLGDAVKQASNVKSPWKAPSKPTLPYLIIFGHAATTLRWLGLAKPLLTSPSAPTKERKKTETDDQEKPTPKISLFFPLLVFLAGVYTKRLQLA
jgi:hypothetical protein